jgi:hypothetical protein
MRKALILLVFVLAACDKEKIAPRLSTGITAERTSPTSVLIKVRVQNERDTATVPLDVEVTAEPRLQSGWGEPVRVIHPVPFVLNKHESRDLQTTLVTSAGARATLTVREAERGLTVVVKTATVD